MNEDRQAARQQENTFRYILFSLAALLVLSLGFTLIPAEPPAPGPPSAADIARSAALEDTLQLRDSAGLLAAPPGTGTSGAAAAGQVVTLLTVQARALLVPDAAGPGHTASTGNPATAAPPAPGTAASDPAAASPATTGAAGPTAEAPSAAALAKELAASGALRLRDAGTTADGGMARLLAGIGTAQLLAAERLHPAAARQAAHPVPAASAVEAPAGCPPTGAAASDSPRSAGSSGPDGAAGPDAAAGSSASPGSGSAAAPSGAAADATSADLPAAVSAVLLAEREAVYAYEAAMPRLAPAAAGPASEFLGRHRNLVAQAEVLFPAACTPAPAQQPGYAIDAGFLQSPAGGLGRLEAGLLAHYGDLIALSDGAARAWAVSALSAAAVRAVHWGADPGPVPGLALDPAQLPQLAGLRRLPVEPS